MRYFPGALIGVSRKRSGVLGSGERFGNHEIVEHLASGGMAELYVARATGPAAFDKLVVLKRILPQLADQQDFVEMFLDEARLAAHLQHQNIAQIHDFGCDDDSYFYTMEYLRGRDLARVLRVLRRDPATIDLAATVGIGIGAATGLHHAHEQRDLSGRHLGMVHRDVSPSNIVVTYDGGVKLVDFGIAKAAGQRVITAVGSIKGKVPYMSPEQCAGEAIDRRSDIYSLGVVLHELAAGRRLFQGDSELQLIDRIMRGDVPPLAAINPRVSPALAHIISTAMHLDPARRFQTGFELAMALEELALTERMQTSALALASWLRRLVGEPEPLVLPDAARAAPEPNPFSDLATVTAADPIEGIDAGLPASPLPFETATVALATGRTREETPSALLRRRRVRLAGLALAGLIVGGIAVVTWTRGATSAPPATDTPAVDTVTRGETAPPSPEALPLEPAPAARPPTAAIAPAAPTAPDAAAPLVDSATRASAPSTGASAPPARAKATPARPTRTTVKSTKRRPAKTTTKASGWNPDSQILPGLE